MSLKMCVNNNCIGEVKRRRRGDVKVWLLTKEGDHLALEGCLFL